MNSCWSFGKGGWNVLSAALLPDQVADPDPEGWLGPTVEISHNLGSTPVSPGIQRLAAKIFKKL